MKKLLFKNENNPSAKVLIRLLFNTFIYLYLTSLFTHLNQSSLNAQEAKNLKINAELRGQRYRLGINLEENVQNLSSDILGKHVLSLTSADVNADSVDEVLVFTQEGKHKFWNSYSLEENKLVRIQNWEIPAPENSLFLQLSGQSKASPVWIENSIIKTASIDNSTTKIVEFKLPKTLSKPEAIIGFGNYSKEENQALVVRGVDNLQIYVLHCTPSTGQCAVSAQFRANYYPVISKAFTTDLDTDGYYDLLLFPGRSWEFVQSSQHGAQWNQVGGQSPGQFAAPKLIAQLPQSEYRNSFFGAFSDVYQKELFVLDQGSSTIWYTAKEDGNSIEVPLNFPRLGALSSITAGDFNADGRKSFIGWNPKLDIWQNITIEARKSPKKVSGPYVCNGYTPQTARMRWGRTHLQCPPNYAIVETDDLGRSKRGDPKHWSINTNCCPLPNEDVLTETKLKTFSECPENYVVTGSQGKLVDNTPSYELTCTKINTARYQLSKIITGKYWGVGTSMSWSQQGFLKEELPLGLQPGVGRSGFNQWDVDGCVAQKVGSLWVGKKNAGGRCANLSFRQLEYRGLKEDPPQGSPVRMFPKCSTLVGVFDPRTGCI